MGGQCAEKRQRATRYARHGTKPNAPNGPISSGITKLSNLIHRQNLILSDEMHVSNLAMESMKGGVGISTTAATTPGLLKAILSCLYIRGFDVTPRGPNY